MVDTTAAVAVGSTSTTERQAYILRTPSDSPLKIVPANFRPVIRLEGKYVAISIVADSADAALKAAKQKGWQPSEDLRKAGEHLPPKMIVLGVSDPREIMPALLASLPGTLQTIINHVDHSGPLAGQPAAGRRGIPLGGVDQPGGSAMMASRLGWRRRRGPRRPAAWAGEVGGRRMPGARSAGSRPSPGGAPAAGGNNSANSSEGPMRWSS